MEKSEVVMRIANFQDRVANLENRVAKFEDVVDKFEDRVANFENHVADFKKLLGSWDSAPFTRIRAERQRGREK